MPENVPHSEGLDIYLFDDSSFDTEFGNEMEEQLTTTKSHDIQQIENFHNRQKNLQIFHQNRLH
jgi:hypothetical protein